ncbi:MAG TPA: WYL domain-containing protein [Gemmatimonadaceae bacterium]|nr:WYL domain-containing protein [Gemmatimonadaceae bacterium]
MADVMTTTTTTIEQLLRQAGRERRCVRATYRYHGEHGPVHYWRLWEPYAIENGHAVVFSYFRDEFRTVPLESIVHVRLHDEQFRPRRPIEL